MQRRQWCLAVAVAVAIVVTGETFAQGQPYPSRPIRMIVGYAAGGPVDAAARIVAPGMQKSLGQPVVIENRGGASGTVGADVVAKAPPDGYTLLFSASATRAINPWLQKSMPFDPLRDFTSITCVVDALNALAVHGDFPAKTLMELVSFARANPGKVTFGSAGLGASNHLSGELLKKLTGTEMLHVPYKGNAPAMADVMGGKITFMFDAVATAVAAAKGGRVRLLGIAGAQRNRAMPDVPTMAEAGLPEFRVPNYYGLEGPANLPAPIVSALNRAMHEALADTDTAAKLVAAGYDLAPSTPEAFDAKVRDTHAHWGRVTAGMKFD